MTGTAATIGAAVDTVSPLRDPNRGRRLVKVVAWIVAIVLLLAARRLLDVDALGWLGDLWK